MLPRLALALAGLSLATSALACDTEDQFVISGTLVPDADLHTGNIEVEVARRHLSTGEQDRRVLTTNADGIFGWPAPIEDAGDDDIYYVVRADVPDAATYFEFTVPEEAALNGGVELPPIELWNMKPSIQRDGDGAAITFAKAPAGVPAAGYTVDTIAVRDEVKARLWSDPLGPDAAPDVRLGAAQLEDFAVSALVYATIEPTAPIDYVAIASGAADLPASESPAVPISRGAACEVGDEACALTDGDLTLTTLPGTVAVVHLDEPAEIDRIVLRGLMAPIGTEIAVDIAPFGRAFQELDRFTVDEAAEYVQLYSRQPRTASSIRIRVLNDDIDSFILAELSAF